MRSVAVSAAVAIAIGAGALVAAWTVQAATLPRAPRADIAAADALVVLEHHHIASSRLRLDAGRPLAGTCIQGWFPRRGTLLRLSDGTRVLDMRGRRLSDEDVAELELAGCPRVLASLIARPLVSGARATAVRAEGLRAVRIRDRRSLLTLYLAPHGNVPVGVAIAGPHGSGRSRIFLEPRA